MAKKITKTSIFDRPRRLAVLVLALGIVGFVASFVLTLEKIEIYKDPSYQPTCNISPLISCGSVMVTEQAEVFGFPNPLIGIIGFTMMGTIGFAMLAGAQFRRLFWLVFQGGLIFGLVFVHWLMYQSIFVIEALCPYCMIAWVATIPAFVYVTTHNLRSGHIRLKKYHKQLVGFLERHHADLVVGWYLAVVAVILVKFWYYWSTLI